MFFLSKTGALGDFVNKMDENVLKRLNGLIEPKIEGTGSFRETDVTLNTPGYTPPSWEKVPERVKNLILKVREMYKKDPLEAAILAHLEIAAVQPFVEGNKRCARLIQDRILFDAEIPPAIIQAGEGKYYLGLLQRTLPAYRTDKIDGQREFYDYCASKVNNGLDEILADISDESIMNN